MIGAVAFISLLLLALVLLRRRRTAVVHQTSARRASFNLNLAPRDPYMPLASVSPYVAPAQTRATVPGLTDNNGLGSASGKTALVLHGGNASAGSLPHVSHVRSSGTDSERQTFTPQRYVISTHPGSERDVHPALHQVLDPSAAATGRFRSTI